MPGETQGSHESSRLQSSATTLRAGWDRIPTRDGQRLILRAQDRERLGLGFWGLAVAALAFRLIFLVRSPVDSDEPQHLHVAWGWARGLVQYRDLFDNHLPLLHLLFAPLVGVLPEESSVFLFARVAMLPVALGCSWLLYVIARPYAGERTAAIAAVLFSILPPWLPKSVEFRNDTLWIFFWLASLALIVGRRRPAYLLSGACAALCVLASIKAAPLFLAHAMALLSQRERVSHRAWIRFAAGAAIPLAAFSIALLLLGAWEAMVYCTLLFNASVPVDIARRVGGAVGFVLVAPLLIRRGSRVSADSNRLLQHLCIFALAFVLVMLCFWPILTRRELVPLTAVAALLIVRRPRSTFVIVSLFVVAAVMSIRYSRLWRPDDLSRHRLVDAAVQITGKTDYVFDLKGDTVFRRRAVRPIYEVVGRALTANGTIADRGPEEIAARGCCAAIADEPRIPPRTRAFLNEHFIGKGPIRVCGTVVRGDSFRIGVPQRYTVEADDPASVAIDGVPYRGPRFLSAGTHSISRGGNQKVTVVWKRSGE